MKYATVIVLAAMTGAIALQLPSPVMARSWTVNVGAGASRAEASRREYPLLPRADRLPASRITCPTLEGYPDCHPDRSLGR
jgi:hypothetical protein